MSISAALKHPYFTDEPLRLSSKLFKTVDLKNVENFFKEAKEKIDEAK